MMDERDVFIFRRPSIFSTIIDTNDTTQLINHHIQPAFSAETLRADKPVSIVPIRSDATMFLQLCTMLFFD